MKTFSLSVLVLFLMQIFTSCASSQEAESYSYEKIDEKRQVWTYRYSVADGPWEEIKVYVKYLKMNYIIFVVTDPGTIMTIWSGRTDNRYFYDALKHPPTQNFGSQTRGDQRSVNSLEEAVETALSWYIEDNIARK